MCCLLLCVSPCQFARTGLRSLNKSVSFGFWHCGVRCWWTVAVRFNYLVYYEKESQAAIGALPIGGFNILRTIRPVSFKDSKPQCKKFKVRRNCCVFGRAVLIQSFQCQTKCSPLRLHPLSWTCCALALLGKLRRHTLALVLHSLAEPLDACGHNTKFFGAQAHFTGNIVLSAETPSHKVAEEWIAVRALPQLLCAPSYFLSVQCCNASMQSWTCPNECATV